MTRISASALDRIVACPASAVLPQVRQMGSLASETGTAVHSFIEKVRARAATLMLAGEVTAGGLAYDAALDMARAEELAKIPDGAKHQTLCESFDFGLIPQGAQLEVAFAWDPRTDTARSLGQNLARDYDGAHPYEIVGTADLVGALIDAVIVADWKTGARLVSAASAWQLKFLALAAARLSGRSNAQVALVYLRADRAYIDRAEFDACDLALFGKQLRKLLERVEEQRAKVDAGRAPDVAINPGCRYCPAMPACPAHARVIGTLIKKVDATQALSDDELAAEIYSQVMALSPEQVGRAWVRLDRGKAYLKLVGEAIETYVRQKGEVVLPGGTQALREVISSRREMDGTIAARVLRERFPELVETAVRTAPDVTKSSIELAVKKQLNGKKGVTKKVDAIVADIEKNDGYPARVSSIVKLVPVENINESERKIA